MLIDVPDDFINEMKKRADKTLACDNDEDFDIYGWSGGQPDDAYQLGLDHGEVYAAREFIGMINQVSSPSEDK